MDGDFDRGWNNQNMQVWQDMVLARLLGLKVVSLNDFRSFFKYATLLRRRAHESAQLCNDVFLSRTAKPLSCQDASGSTYRKENLP